MRLFYIYNRITELEITDKCLIGSIAWGGGRFGLSASIMPPTRLFKRMPDKLKKLTNKAVSMGTPKAP